MTNKDKTKGLKVDLIETLTNDEIKLRIDRLLLSSMQEVMNLASKDSLKDPNVSALDMMISRMIVRSVTDGDEKVFEKLLDRSIGKVSATKKDKTNQELFAQILIATKQKELSKKKAKEQIKEIAQSAKANDISVRVIEDEN